MHSFLPEALHMIPILHLQAGTPSQAAGTLFSLVEKSEDKTSSNVGCRQSHPPAGQHLAGYIMPLSCHRLKLLVKDKLLVDG